jgi:hypothetical protein
LIHAIDAALKGPLFHGGANAFFSAVFFKPAPEGVSQSGFCGMPEGMP